MYETVMDGVRGAKLAKHHPSTGPENLTKPDIAGDSPVDKC
jgi:hypothetical protein